MPTAYCLLLSFIAVLLIHPPVVKPSEPPPGIAKLSGALTACGIHHRVIDANIEGLYYLLHKTITGPVGFDTWTRRALRNLSKNLKGLKGWEIYTNIDRYKRAVMDVNRLTGMSAVEYGVRMSLVDYQQKDLSPSKSDDLLHTAGHYGENPFYPYFSERIAQLIEKKNPGFAGFSLNYLSQALTTFSIIGFIKKRFPAVKIIVGGGLVTSWMRSPSWRNPFAGLIDHLVAGPGEAQLISLLGKKTKMAGHYPPCYDSLLEGKYLAPGFILPYSTSTGCYWSKCSFCPERAEGNEYLQAHPDSVIDDLHALSKQVKPALIHLVDNAISPAMMKKIAENPPGAPWYGFVRITPRLADIDFCQALKKSGCVMLKLGLESGDQEVIDSMNKGINLETVSQALRTIKGAGIATYVYLLFGTPSETVKEARRTLDFTVKHAEYIDFLNLAIFNLPLNSPEASGLSTGKFYEGDLSLYVDFKHPKGWGRRQIRQFLDKEFKKHPAIQPILQRNPPFFTSNHAPLLGLSSPPPRA